jgi:lipoprotein|nr:hypothetical protein [uncultured Capnocytophaga sp.]
MKKIISIITILALSSCKTFPDYPQIHRYVYDEEAYFKGKDCSFKGKVLYKGKELYQVAIKLTVNKDYCEISYVDFDGNFYFCLDTTKINEQSYIEFVSEGYERKKMWLKKFLKTDKIVELKKGKKNVSAKEYMYFHENIRGCSLFSDIVED